MDVRIYDPELEKDEFVNELIIRNAKLQGQLELMRRNRNAALAQVERQRVRIWNFEKLIAYMRGI